MGPREDEDVLRRRLERERRARREAETIAERATSDLYASVAKLERLNSELEEANQAIREFVAIASHDLNNPLTSILGFAEILMRDASDADKGYLDVILRQGARMQRLVSDLLVLSRLEAGAVVPQVARVCVRDELERTLAELGDDAHGIRIDDDPDLAANADPDHVHRILLNYLTNALKYGGEPIVAGASSDGDYVAVRIIDHGPGVPQDFEERLFSRFARAESVGRSAPGTGLGLSIVRGLAEANGGTAFYERVSPKGSCFGVRLPRAS